MLSACGGAAVQACSKCCRSSSMARKGATPVNGVHVFVCVCVCVALGCGVMTRVCWRALSALYILPIEKCLSFLPRASIF